MALTIVNLRLHMQQFFHTFNAGRSPLKILDLFSDIFQRPGEHTNVKHQQIGRTNGDLLLAIQIGSQRQTGRIADHIEKIDAEECCITHKPGKARSFEQTTHQRKEAMYDILLGSGSSDVLSAGDVLLQKTIEICCRLALRCPAFHTDLLSSTSDKDRHEAVET